MFPDRIHPSEAGYGIWAEELGKLVREDARR
jgi:lysophospholipase L1-like esterase